MSEIDFDNPDTREGQMLDGRKILMDLQEILLDMESRGKWEAHLETGYVLGFNMDSIMSSRSYEAHECNTVACIAGWVVALRNPKVVEDYSESAPRMARNWGSLVQRAREILMDWDWRDHPEVDWLFGLSTDPGAVADLTDVPPGAAAQAIGQFLRGEKINWVEIQDDYPDLEIVPF